MLHGEVRSPHLRALLAYEAEKHGLPVRFQQTVLRDGFQPPPFRREAVILSHAEYHPEVFGIRLADEEVLVRVPAHMLNVGEPVGYVDEAGELVPLGAVIRNVLVVFVSLEALAQPDAVLSRRALNGHAPTKSVLASVFDLVVSQAMPQLKANIEGYDWSEETRRFTAARIKGLQERVTQMRHDIALNDRGIEEKTYELMRAARKNRELRQHVAFLEDHTQVELRKDAEQEFMALTRLAPAAFSELDIQEDRITARTYPVTIEHDDHDYDLGTFQLTVGLDKDEVHIRKILGDQPEGYPHPHVSTAGVPCYGNIGPAIAKLLVEGQFSAALSVLLQFLRSYNPGDAYIRLENWDPDWQEERWDRCYENAGTDDCIDCDETDCPFYADRYERCWEGQQYGSDGMETCIRCRECGYHEDAERSCREDSARSTCIDCDLPCSFAKDSGDIEECREDNPEDCENCPASACPYQGQADENDDELGEEVAA